jgi:2-polyprenyl-3-methyl-5-hydroxy-6-metoxy-1,4-benzoquinol methylase
MPANPVAPRRMERLTLEERLAQPRNCQRHWYLRAGQSALGLSVLDVGAGTGEGIAILREAGAARCWGIDPLPAGPDVYAVPVEQVPSASFDAVTCMDVIEHVEDDAILLWNLLRIARRWVFLSTPRYQTTRPIGEFHLREYTPEEFAALLGPRTFTAWTPAEGEPAGRKIATLEEGAISWGVLVPTSA